MSCLDETKQKVFKKKLIENILGIDLFGKSTDWSLQTRR